MWEEYEVKFNYEKPDGSWEMGKVEKVAVRLKGDMKEGENQQKVEDTIKKMYPGCVVISITYLGMMK